MKKLFLMLLCVLLLLTGCGASESTTEATTEGSELSLLDSYINDYPEEVKQYIELCESLEQDSYVYANVKVTEAGHMAEVADYITKSISELPGEHTEYDITVRYTDPDKGWVCTWTSKDNKTGTLINTLTNYTEENVTIDDLYKCNK